MLDVTLMQNVVTPDTEYCNTGQMKTLWGQGLKCDVIHLVVVVCVLPSQSPCHH